MRSEAKRHALDALWTEAVASALALFIYYASGLHGLLALSSLIIAGTLSLAAIRLSLSFARNAYFGKVSRDALSAYLSSVIDRKNAGVSYGRALSAALENVGYAPLKEKISVELKRRFMQGDEYAGRHTLGDRRWTIAELRKASQRDEANQTAIEESAQRYATLNMFVSTVLPSFMTFAFIGSSILSQASFSLFFFSAALLFAMPVFYCVGNMLMWRRLLA